jgi:hypothetical protein
MTHYSNTGNPIDFPKLSTIDKLWGKALDRVVPDTYSSLSLTQVEKVKTVFAELIVKEMLQTCEDHPTWTGRMIGEEIKQHFGVE